VQQEGVRVERSDDGFTAWASSRQQALLRTAVLLTGDQGRAEDLVQEALVKVATRWAKLADGYPDAYARTIIYRDNVSWWRRRRDVPVGVLPDDAAPYDAHGAERRLMVAAALGRLTAKQRTVLVMRYFDDLTEAECARVLGVSVGTVKSQAHAAIARLRTGSPELAYLLDGAGVSDHE
jgi:RNA polymerase sigma-70 factor (sigma-E family)